MDLAMGLHVVMVKQVLEDEQIDFLVDCIN